MAYRRRAALRILLVAFAGLALAHGRARAGDEPPDASWEACSNAYERAQVERKGGRLRDARRSLLQCIEPACPATARTDCTKWLGEVEAGMPTVVLDAKDEKGRQLTDVRVSVDGGELATRLDGVALAIDPGTHRFRFEAPRHAPIEQEVTVLEGEKNRRVTADWRPAHAAAEPPASQPRRSLVGPLVIGGVGLVALGSFAYFGLTSIEREDDLRSTCGPSRTCAEDDLDEVYGRRAVADVSLGVGAIALGVATVWLIVELSRGPSPSRAQLPAPGVRF